MNDQPKRQVNRTWDEAERKKHGKQVRERFAHERDEKIRLVKQVIADLLDQGLTISQNEVARQSGISVGFINKHLKAEVERARKKQLEAAKKPKTPRHIETVEKEVERLKLTVRRLQDELSEEKRKNKELLAQVGQVVDLEDEIELLKNQNRELITYYRASQDKVVNLPVQPPMREKPTSPQKKKEAVSSSPRTPEPPQKPESLPEPEKGSIPEEIEPLGIKLNSTLKKTMKNASTEQILEAIEAVKDQMSRNEVKNPSGLLNKAIKEGWTKAEPHFPTLTEDNTNKTSNNEPSKPEMTSSDELASTEDISTLYDLLS
jgi:hypothetical protein